MECGSSNAPDCAVAQRRDEDESGQLLWAANRCSRSPDKQISPYSATSLRASHHCPGEHPSRAAISRRCRSELAPHANRVATMGQLTASIAHEINQPIATTRTNAAAALRFLDKSTPDVAGGEGGARLDCERRRIGARRLVVDFQIGSLIKKAPPRKEVVDLNAAILDVTALTHGEALKTGVTVGTQLADELPCVQCDRVQLQQVMLNLIVNAIQSMSGVEDGNPRITRHQHRECRAGGCARGGARYRPWAAPREPAASL